MTSVKSSTLNIQAPASKLFTYLSDFNNFGKILPPQISEWKSTADSCSFKIQNMATLAMHTKEKIEPTLLVIESEAPSPFNFELVCHFDIVTEHSCRSTIEFNADMPAMVAMMAQKPLQNFVDMLNRKLKEVSE